MAAAGIPARKERRAMNYRHQARCTALMGGFRLACTSPGSRPVYLRPAASIADASAWPHVAANPQPHACARSAQGPAEWLSPGRCFPQSRRVRRPQLLPEDAELGERDERHRIARLHLRHILWDVDQPVGGAQAADEAGAVAS